MNANANTIRRSGAKERERHAKKARATLKCQLWQLRAGDCTCRTIVNVRLHVRDTRNSVSMRFNVRQPPLSLGAVNLSNVVLVFCTFEFRIPVKIVIKPEMLTEINAPEIGVMVTPTIRTPKYRNFVNVYTFDNIFSKIKIALREIIR